MSVDPVVPTRPEPEPVGPADQRRIWVVQPGDSLGGIARALRRGGMPGTLAELVRTLCRLNPEIHHPDRIEVGQVLQLPPGGASATCADRPGPRSSDTFEGGASCTGWWPGPLFRADERGQLLKSALFRLMQARPFTRGRAEGGSVAPGPAREHPRSPDGTPLFRQGDPAWSAERLGQAAEGPTLSQAGCAVTACAMALSRMSGTIVTPDGLVRYLRKEGGFQGSLLDWSRAAGAVAGVSGAAAGPFDAARLDRELEAGRPVLLRVAHDQHGSDRQHWICVTARDSRSGLYSANDPATGRSTALVLRDGVLASASGEPIRYASDGRMVTFVNEGAPSRA
jgi:hypothetical protein